MAVQSEIGNISHNDKKNKPLAHILLWVFLWPAVAGVIVLLGLMLGAQVAGSLLSGNPDSDSYFTASTQVSILVAVILFAIVSFKLKRLMSRSSKSIISDGARVVGYYLLVGILLGGIAMVSVSAGNISDDEAAKLTIPQLEQDPQLLNILESVGVDTSDLNNLSIVYIDSYQDETMDGEYEPITDDNNVFLHGKITVKRGQGPEVEKATVAHEYLHYIWDASIDVATQEELTSQLITLYGKDTQFQDDIIDYSESNSLLPTELFSFYCTESSDEFLTEFIINQCNEYIDRSTLEFLR